jgi:hypothetical protein
MRPKSQRQSTMWRNIVRGLVAIALMTTGTTLISASPALAGGNCNGLWPVSACVDFGNAGTKVRLDFYMNQNLSNQHKTYKSWFNVNGTWYLAGSGTLDHKGNYCCKTKEMDSEPDSWKTVYTEIDIYDSNGVYKLSSTSGPIRIYL